jgi:hypothetical protein
MATLLPYFLTVAVKTCGTVPKVIAKCTLAFTSLITLIRY